MLEERPDDALNCMSLAVTEVRGISTTYKAEHSQFSVKILKEISASSNNETEVPTLRHRVRLCNYGNEIRLKDFRSHSVGHLVTFRGTIVRVSSVIPLVKSLHFICELCSFKWRVHLSDGNYKRPTVCERGYCKGKVISPSLRVEDVETIDYQQIRLGIYK